MAQHFFPMIYRMRYIHRWGLMRNTEQENIQEHSHMVAVLAHALATIENQLYGGCYDVGQVTVAALYHDASEIFTGDLPTPIKYDNPEIQNAYQSVERTAQKRLLSMLPDPLQSVYEPAILDVSPKIHTIVKAADRLSAYIKCIEELKVGNTEFLHAKEQIYQSLCDSTLHSVRYFMQECLPGFELTLDELQSTQ